MLSRQGPEPSSVISRANPGNGAKAYGLLGFFIAVTLCLELARLPLVVLVDPVRHALGIDDFQVSLLLGGFSSVPFVVMSLVGGWLSDRASRKLLLIVAATIWTVGALFCATAHGFASLAAGRVLVGLGAGMKLPIAMTWINDAFPAARRGRAIGAFFVVLGSGPSLAVILAGATVEAARRGQISWLYPLIGASDPWRATVFALALPTLFIVPFALALSDRRWPDDPRTAAVKTGAGPEWSVLGPSVLIVLAASLIAFVDASCLSWFSTLLIRSYRFSAQAAGLLFGVSTLIAGLAGPLIGGYAGDILFRRFGSHARPALAGATAIICAPTLFAYLVDQPLVLGIALAIAGVCTVTVLSLSYVAVQAVLPVRARGLGTGLMSACTTLIGSAGPTAVALVSSRLFPNGTLAPAIVLVGGGASVAAGLLLIWTAALQRRSLRRGAGANQ